MNVPKLRFKADDGSEFPEWEEKRLGDICKPLMYGMGAAAIPYDGQNKYIRITDIDDESHKYKSNDIVSPAGMLEEKYLVCKGDILLARTGASTGKSYLYDEKDGKMYFAGFLIKAHVNEECDAKFIYAQTLTTKYMNWVKLTSMRSGQPGINANEYSSYAVSIACIPEQRKIASFLSTIDEIIQSTESELNAWQERKKGVMQKIFNREVRFKADDGSEFPEWEEKRLGEVTSRVTRRNNNMISDIPLTISGVYGLIDQRKYFNKIVAASDLSNYYLLKSGEFAYNRSSSVGYDFGAIKRLDSCECGAVSTLYVCFSILDENDVCSDYLRVYFDSNIWNKYAASVCAEGARNHGLLNISVNDFFDMPVFIPSLPEQKRIAECLSAIDEVITLTKKELSAWKEFKKGLLQQMFV